MLLGKLSPQLKARYAKDSIHWEEWSILIIHSHSLEYGTHPIALGQFKSFGVWFGYIHEDLGTLRCMAT
jgi:hypothetical protein